MQEQILQKRKNTADHLFIAVFALGVIALRVLYITRTTGPFIYADEFGYWSHAAHMTGHTWAGVMNGVSWYSFGYSFWLALTFLFSDQMIVMFRIAVLLNGLMCLGIYALAYRIVRKLVARQSVFTCALIAFALTCFPTYIFYSYTTMAETVIALVAWLLFYEVISLEENPVWWKGVLLGITTGYAYMVHNRMLTAVFAVIVCVIALWMMRRIDWKIIVSFGISILGMLLLFVLVKNFLNTMIVSNQAIAGTGTAIDKGTANTFERVFRKFAMVFRLENIVKPFLSVMGQLWQCLSATYLLLGTGIVYCICRLRNSISGKQNLCVYAYPVLAFFFSVGLTGVISYGSLGKAGRTRIDQTFYGRYNECYFPLLIMMGLIMICEKQLRGTWKIYAGVGIVYLALTIGMFFRLRGVEDGYLNIVSSVSIHIFHWLGGFGVWKCCLVTLLGGGVIIGLCHMKSVGRLGFYAGLLALIFLFFATALYCMRMSIRGENDYTMQFAPLYDYLNENTQKGEIVYTGNENKAAFDLQTRLVDQAVVCVTVEQLGGVRDAYAVVREEQMEELTISDYDVCLECEGQVLLRLGNQAD